MNDESVYVDTEEIQEFLFKNLIRKGYVPEEDELADIADVVFDFLIHKQIMEEETE